MASMSRCIVCKKCKFPELKCEIYANGIPHDVVNEITDCNTMSGAFHQSIK